MPWRELPHTADLRLEVRARNWPELLAEATMALAAQLGSPAADAEKQERALQLETFDREELLVRWLSEVLVWHELEGVAPVAVTVGKAEGGEACGTFSLAAVEERLVHIKAVTYHGLAVETCEDGLVVRIVFDT